MSEAEVELWNHVRMLEQDIRNLRRTVTALEARLGNCEQLSIHEEEDILDERQRMIAVESLGRDLLRRTRDLEDHQQHCIVQSHEDHGRAAARPFPPD